MQQEIEDLIAEADRAYEDVFNVARRERDLIRRLAEIAELHALCDDRLWGVEKHAERMEAERDAAVAAVERVRKYADERSVYAKTRNNTVGSWRIASDLYDLLGVSLEEQAALDGAPDAATDGDYYEGLEEGIKIGRAECDAAVAAIERVRELVEEWRYGIPEYTSSHYQEGQKDQQRKLVGQLRAALDGAPEPEWEYGLRWNGETIRSGSRETVDGYFEMWGGQIVRRRPAGPWLPVEGESNDA